jgi:hypothetical protein
MFCFVNVSKMCVNVFTKRARLALALFNPLEKKNNIILFLKNRRICFVWILKKVQFQNSFSFAIVSKLL